MELNPGYALITTDEYQELIETSFYQEEIIHENEKLKEEIIHENEKLKKEIRELQEFMLEENIDDYDLKKGTMEEVTNPKDFYFPFDKDFLEKLKMPIKDVIEFIRLKKTDLLEKEENHE